MNLIITDYKITVLKVPIQKALYQRNTTIKELIVLVLELTSHSELVGQSFIYGMGRQGHTAIIPYLKNELMPAIIGKPFLTPSEIWETLWLPRRDKLRGGLSLFALALIDIACWDLAGKQLKKSLHTLLKRNSDKAQIYGSGGWINMSPKELYNECCNFIEQGIKIYKIKIGSPNDEKRIDFLRKEFDSKIKIAVDANQFFTFEEAIKKAAILNNYNITWLEDPLFVDSMHQSKELSEKINIPICLGENFSLVGEFEDLCRLNAANVVQVDVVRCGGISPFNSIIKITNDFKKPVITHLNTELSISLLGLSEYPLSCEYLNLFPTDFFTNPFAIKNGCVLIPSCPGTGVYISPEKIKKYML